MCVMLIMERCWCPDHHHIEYLTVTKILINFKLALPSFKFAPHVITTLSTSYALTAVSNSMYFCMHFFVCIFAVYD